MYITRFNGKKRKIPKSLALLLQGSQEGGVVTTIGLFFGDRLYQLKYFLLFHVFILYIVIMSASGISILLSSMLRRLVYLGMHAINVAFHD